MLKLGKPQTPSADTIQNAPSSLPQTTATPETSHLLTLTFLAHLFHSTTWQNTSAWAWQRKAPETSHCT